LSFQQTHSSKNVEFLSWINYTRETLECLIAVSFFFVLSFVHSPLDANFKNLLLGISNIYISLRFFLYKLSSCQVCIYQWHIWLAVLSVCLANKLLQLL